MLITLLLLLLTAAAAAETVDGGSCGDNLTWTLDDLGTLTVSGSGEMSGTPWNRYNGDIRKVVLQEGAESISERAFMECSALTEVLLPATLKSIGAYALIHCAVAAADFPASLTEIGDGAFDGCTGLREVTYSLDLYSRLHGMTVGSGNGALADAEWRYYTHHLSGGRCSDDGCDFVYDPAGLNVLKTPTALTAIGDNAFRGVPAQVIDIPDRCGSLGNGAFADCGNVRYVLMPSGLKDTVLADPERFFAGCPRFHLIFRDDAE